MTIEVGIRAEALERAIEATRPIAAPVPAGANTYFGTVALPDASKIVQTAAVFEAYLRNGAIR